MTFIRRSLALPTLAVPLVATLLLVGCGSENGGSTVSAADEEAVTGEFHAIAPDAVADYVAEHQTRRAKLRFTLDGHEHELRFVGLDEDRNLLIAEFGEEDILLIGFDLEAEEPRPMLGVVEREGETIVREFTASDLELTPTDDIVYEGRLREIDGDAEVDVELVLNQSLLTHGTSTITVSGDEAVLEGDLGTGTYVQIRDMIASAPNVSRLIIRESTGSINDDINVHTGRLVREAGLATHVPANGNINSGAVDLFAAGLTRTVAPGGVLGVHSWCCHEDRTANELPRSDPAHGIQLTYFREMLGEKGERFYFFTLEAAPFDGIHPMTREEMRRHDLLTK